MSAPALLRPGYRPEECTPGWLHLGVGNFHRAHQALYVDRLLHRPDGREWGIIGINLRPSEQELIARLKARANRYVLNANATDGSREFREIASLLQLIDHVSEPERAQRALALASVRIVTLTVTGAGYYLRQAGGLDREDPAIAAELAGGEAATIYGYLRAGLARRIEAGAGPLSILSCDNMRGNGKLLKESFYEYLEMLDDRELIAWLDANATFPCAMVDRITPVPPASLAPEVAGEFGVVADASVMAEDFIQWVVEDDFAAARPALEEVGVQIVPSVCAYEEAKIRILNGGHCAVAYCAALRGHTYVWEAMADPKVTALFDRYQTREVIPAYPGASPINLDDYQRQIKERFANQALDDTVARICRRGTTKIPEFVLPTIKGNYAMGKVPQLALTVVAAWFEIMCRCAAGAGPIAYDDANWDRLKPLLHAKGAREFATNAWLWGELPSEHPGFIADLQGAINGGAPAS